MFQGVLTGEPLRSDALCRVQEEQYASFNS